MDFTDTYPITKSAGQNTFEYSPGSTFLATVQHVVQSSESAADESMVQRRMYASSSSASSDSGMTKSFRPTSSLSLSHNDRKRLQESKSSLIDIRASTTLQIVRTWTLSFLVHSIRWSNDGSMILCAGKNRFCVMVVDPRLAPLRKRVEEENALEINQDTLLSVKAGAEGLIRAHWIDNETICSFTSDHLQAMLYDIRSGDVTVINCPNSSKVFVSPSRTYVAFLTKREGVDQVTILKHSRCLTSSDWKTFQEFPARTNDASNLCWSPDERYLVIWDGILEYKVQIFSLFGHLQATYLIESDEPNTVLPLISSNKALSISPCAAAGLGIRELQWSSNGKLIAMGDYSDQIRFLETREWNECKSFDLTNLTSSKDQTLNTLGWKEPGHWQSSSEGRAIVTFESMKLPTIISSIQNDLNKLNPKAGICWMEWNAKGDLLAVRSENMPNALFIFQVPVASTQSFDSVPIFLSLIVFSMPISQALWRPNKQSNERSGREMDELSIICQSNAIYTWRQITQTKSVTEQIVEAIPIPIEGFMAKYLSSSPDGRTLVIISDNNTFCCAMDAIDQSAGEMSFSHL